MLEARGEAAAEKNNDEYRLARTHTVEAASIVPIR
jgi:hypothetical protein